MPVQVAGLNKRVAIAMEKFTAIRSATQKITAELRALESRRAAAVTREGDARIVTESARAAAAELQRRLDAFTRRKQRRLRLGLPDAAADLPARVAALGVEVSSLRTRRDSLRRILDRMTSIEGLSAAAVAETARQLEDVDIDAHPASPTPGPSPSAGPLAVGSPVSIDPTSGAIVPPGTPGAVAGRIVEVFRQ